MIAANMIATTIEWLCVSCDSLFIWLFIRVVLMVYLLMMVLMVSTRAGKCPHGLTRLGGYR